MIKLSIPTPHCHYCLEFEADVENAQIFCFSNRPLGISDTMVRCKHRDSCKGIKGYNNMLRELALKEEIAKDLKLSKEMNANCSYVDEQEQKETEKLNIDFDDLDGKELSFKDGGDRA